MFACHIIMHKKIICIMYERRMIHAARCVHLRALLPVLLNCLSFFFLASKCVCSKLGKSPSPLRQVEPHLGDIEPGQQCGK